MKENQEGKGIDGFALVEIMGHKRYAGRISEHVVAGQGFVRVDVPATGGRDGFTKLFGAASIYCITVIGADEALALAAELREVPIDAWRYRAPEIRELSAPAEDTGAGDDDGNEW